MIWQQHNNYIRIFYLLKYKMWNANNQEESREKGHTNVPCSTTKEASTTTRRHLDSTICTAVASWNCMLTKWSSLINWVGWRSYEDKFQTYYQHDKYAERSRKKICLIPWPLVPASPQQKKCAGPPAPPLVAKMDKRGGYSKELSA